MAFGGGRARSGLGNGGCGGGSRVVIRSALELWGEGCVVEYLFFFSFVVMVVYSILLL